jgi:nitrilase
VHVDQLPAELPQRDRLWPGVRCSEDRKWVEPGNSVIVGPDGSILAGPVRHEETILIAEVNLDQVQTARRLFDPTGHYHRPDIFRLSIDVAARPPFTQSNAVIRDPGSDVLADVAYEARHPHLQLGNRT